MLKMALDSLRFRKVSSLMMGVGRKRNMFLILGGMNSLLLFSAHIYRKARTGISVVLELKSMIFESCLYKMILIYLENKLFK
jgi:hypothetical protein